MDKNAKIYVAGHRGLVGSALVRKLETEGYKNLIVRTSKELDLRNQLEVNKFFEQEKPDYVFIAAAKVGGIIANSTNKAQFFYDNVMIAVNIIQASYKAGVKKLLNLGSSCIYPKMAPQPLKEEYLLTGPLEHTNDAYAIAKIAAIKMCKFYNEQFGTDFISAMPTNLYGPNDNFDLINSHVLPAFIRKFHLAKLLYNGEYKKIIEDFKKHGSVPHALEPLPELDSKTDEELKQYCNILAEFYGISPDHIVMWGSGSPYREFLHVDDLADACFHLMKNYSAKQIGELVNVGTGKECTIKELAEMIAEIVGYKGELDWDTSKPDGTPRKLQDVSRLSALGWEAKIGLKEGIAREYEGY